MDVFQHYNLTMSLEHVAAGCGSRRAQGLLQGEEGALLDSYGFFGLNLDPSNLLAPMDSYGRI